MSEVEELEEGLIQRIRSLILSMRGIIHMGFLAFCNSEIHAHYVFIPLSR